MGNFNEIGDDAKKLYEKGKRKVTNLDNSLCECGGELAKKVKEKPLTSLLIAAGIGFLLSHLFKK